MNSDEKEVAEILNDYFINITQTLGTLQENKGNPVKYQKQSSCEGIIKHFQLHPSILKIKASVPCTHMFSFKRVTVAEMKLQLQHLNIKKSSPQEEIPTKLLKLNTDLFCYPLTRLFNLYVDANKFPDDLKLTDVTALYKKDDRMNKTNYRPISLLPTISKIFERLIHIQLYDFIALKLSALLGGFRKNYNTQHVLLNFLQDCKNIIDKKGFAGAVFMDLSKAFDSMNHGLLIAKLHAYGLSIEALELIQNYLSHRKQRVKLNSTFSAWKEIKVGVPQGSVLGPLLFNVFINDIFLFVNKTKICNYADDTTIYACHTDPNTIIKNLEADGSILANWFSSNFMKLNDDKCHLMIFGNTKNVTTIKIGNAEIKESHSEKLLGITFDKKLSFKKHIEDLCKKANQKLHALARVSYLLDPAKKETLMNAFIKSQFNYCPLVWMFHDRGSNSKINRTQERALKLVCRDSGRKLELERGKTLSNHQRNLQLLMIEVYKAKHNISPEFMKDVFFENHNNYNLRSDNHLRLPKIVTTKYGTENVMYRGYILWSSLPKEIKNSSTLSEFERRLKSNWDENICNCRLCKVFILGVGFL